MRIAYEDWNPGLDARAQLTRADEAYRDREAEQARHLDQLDTVVERWAEVEAFLAGAE